MSLKSFNYQYYLFLIKSSVQGGELTLTNRVLLTKDSYQHRSLQRKATTQKSDLFTVFSVLYTVHYSKTKIALELKTVNDLTRNAILFHQYITLHIQTLWYVKNSYMYCVL